MPLLSKIDPKELDEDIMPLVQELNRMGLKTRESCSGHLKRFRGVLIPIRAYISFDIQNLQVQMNKKSIAIHWPRDPHQLKEKKD
jgi:tRNA(Phe) wybutosine-synthesizing methylase Tyw3